MRAPAVPLSGVALLAVLAAAWWVTRGRQGGLQQAAVDAAAAVVDAAGQVVEGATVGAVGQVGAVVGLPTPAQTIDDAGAVRWIADNFGLFEASKWATAGALFRHFSLPTGTGVPPPPGSAAGLALGVTAADVARAINRGG